MKSSNQNVASCPATGADHHRVPGDFIVSSNQYERGSALFLASSSRNSFKGMASCKLDLGPVSSAKVSYDEQCINQYDNSAAITPTLTRKLRRESDAELSCRYLAPTGRRISPTVSVPSQRHDEVKTRVGGNPHSKAPSRRIAPIRCSYINKYGMEDVKSCLRSNNNRDEKADPTPLPNTHERDSFLDWDTKERHEAWVCSACSFVNEDPLHLTCSICATTRGRN